MTDRELLERAARAAGIDVISDGNRFALPHPIIRDRPGIDWNPINSDGDALRLQARLNLNLGFDLVDEGVEVSVMAVWDGGPDVVSEIYEGNDAAPAMRRPIVRAAASMVED